ncbi:MAG: flagellar assembly regulator FliX [Variibacter sp.]|nr:flagellar assembly regulator FliX [Variibacter sp.]
MRVDPARRSGIAAAATPARRSAGGGFAVAEAGAAPGPAATAAPRATASIGALIALQAFDDPSERRRRAVKRGRTTLDALEELKLGLLAGTLHAGHVARLEAAAAAMGESSGDSRLDAILAEVRLRAAVELAKLSPAAGRDGPA